jgi:alkylhydroperoxidase family enzyme
MCLMAAFVPHRPNKYFHVTASNGIVSSSPYTPLAIMVRDADVVSLRSVRSHRSIHCWHGHAARRSALPRERFSPLAQSGRSLQKWDRAIGSDL